MHAIFETSLCVSEARITVARFQNRLTIPPQWCAQWGSGVMRLCLGHQRCVLDDSLLLCSLQPVVLHGAGFTPLRSGVQRDANSHAVHRRTPSQHSLANYFFLSLADPVVDSRTTGSDRSSSPAVPSVPLVPVFLHRVPLFFVSHAAAHPHGRGQQQ